jgi:hypothetical protein
MNKVTAAAIGAALLLGCAGYAYVTRPAPVAPMAEPAPPVFHAGDLVKAQRGFACNSLALLDEQVAHAKAREKLKFQGMFKDGQCAIMPTEVSYKVVSTQVNRVEIVAAPATAPGSFWTLDTFIGQ